MKSLSLKFVLGLGLILIIFSYCLFIFTDNPKQLLWGEPDYFSLGQYYFNHGDKADGTYDIEKARYYYEEAIKEDPQGNKLQWHQLGRIDFLEGKFDEALEKFTKQQEYFGDTLPNTYYMLGLTYGYRARYEENEADWQLAEKNFETYLEFDPQSPWARTDLAWILFSQGKYEDMAEILEIGLTYQPNNPWLLNMYGLALLNTGDKEKARRYFLWAEAEAENLTVEEWGKSYPGNDPRVWAQGLNEFKDIIAKNLVLTNS